MWPEGNAREIGQDIEISFSAKRNEKATYGTKLVWKSLRSTFNDQSNRSEAVIDETTWAMSRLRVVKLGDVMFRFFLQMS